MSKEDLPEFWLRGPVQGIEKSMQPIAHALLQAQQEVNILMLDLDDKFLWVKPGGLASPAFHLQHITGVIDRLLTYKNNLPLTVAQLAYLENEGKFNTGFSKETLLGAFNNSINTALKDLKETDGSLLTEARVVGRVKLPSTVGGLLFHIAEHTMRHTGQLLVTVKMLKNWV